MDVSLTDNEIHAIKIWAESSIHGGHWGDGDLIVPEEDILLKKIGSMKNNSLSITEYEARIILAWSDSTLGIYTLEEESVIKKIRSILNVKI